MKAITNAIGQSYETGLDECSDEIVSVLDL